MVRKLENADLLGKQGFWPFLTTDDADCTDGVGSRDMFGAEITG